MRRGIAVTLAAAGILVGSATSAAWLKHEPAPLDDQLTDPAARAAFRYFESVQDVEVLLRQRRPISPTAAYRAMAIGALPQQGNLMPTAPEAAKLSGIRAVAAFHGREDDIELRVVVLGGEAFIGLHARTFLLVTRETLALVDGHELQALVAHELGHDYVWEEYEHALCPARSTRISRRVSLALSTGLTVVHGETSAPEAAIPTQLRYCRWRTRRGEPLCRRPVRK